MNHQPATSPQNVSEAGEQRSSRNATRPGLLAKIILVQGESHECYLGLEDSFYNRLQPQDQLEETLVFDLINCSWKMQRHACIETSMMNDAIAEAPSATHAKRLALGFEKLSHKDAYRLLQRYDTMVHRNFHRSLQVLLALKQVPQFPPAPTPDPEPERAPEPVPQSQPQTGIEQTPPGPQAPNHPPAESRDLPEPPAPAQNVCVPNEPTLSLLNANPDPEDRHSS